MNPATTAVCGSCGFENPRAWRACARCGHSLAGSAARRTGLHPVLGASADGTSVDIDLHTDPEPDRTPTGEPEDVLDRTEVGGAPPDEAEAPLIGQTEAAETIRSAIERAFTLGQPTLVALEGGRGTGKTRLLMYASEVAARANPEVRVLYASCRAGGDGPYAPWSRLLLDRFGVTPASAPSAVRGQMATVVSESLNSSDAIQIAETTHLLGHIAGIPFPSSPFLDPLEQRPDELRRRAALALRKLIEGEASRRPVLVLLDNMHVTEQDGWDLLEVVCSAQAHVAVVVAGDVGTIERASKLTPTGGVATGPIAPFSEADVAAMLLVLLPALVAVPEPLVAAVTHRSRGNAGALKELVLGLVEAGVFVPAPGGLEVDMPRLEGGDLPVSMEDAIRARLARLDPLERATLDRAAVVGETFWEGALLAQMRSERESPGDATDPASLWPDDEDEAALRGAVARLAEKGFVVSVGQWDLPGAHEFNFVHAGTRDLLYREQDELNRVRRHAVVARWLAVLAELRREGVAAMIAPHLERAGLKARAGRAYLEAAAYERSKMRTTTALRHIERALPLIDPDDTARRIDAHHEHGSLLTTLGRYDEALAAFAEMLRLAWQVGARNKGGAALNRIARVHRQRGEDRMTQELLNRALALFRDAGDMRGVASTLDDLAQVQRLRGDVEAAIAGATEALEIRRAHDDRRGEAVSLTTIGSIELGRGNLDAAGGCFEDALAIFQTFGDREGVMRTLNSLGILAQERGNLDAAIERYRAALAEAREMADRRGESFALNNLGEALVAAGKPEEAQSSLEQAKSLALELGDLRAEAEIERNLGIAALKLDDADAAEKILKRALSLAEAYGSREMIALAHRAIGQVRAKTLFASIGEVDKRAEESFLASIDIFREIGNEKEAARSLADLGYHLIERGDLETARERLHEARAMMRKMGLSEADRIERTLSDLH